MTGCQRRCVSTGFGKMPLCESAFLQFQSIITSLASFEPRETYSSEMDLPMAHTAKGDEIFFHIPSQKAARLNMMNLQIFGTSASLAPPPISSEDLKPETPISTFVQAKLRMS
jgi:hypothetical protein